MARQTQPLQIARIARYFRRAASLVALALAVGESFAQQTHPYAFQLQKGWNLISIPTNLTAWSLGTNYVQSPFVPSNCLVAIDRFNALTQLFEVSINYFDGAVPWGWWPSANNPDFTHLLPGVGYILEAATACTASVSGITFRGEEIAVSLWPGWNLIGWSSVETPIARALNSIDGKWDATLGIYRHKLGTMPVEYEIYSATQQQFNTLEPGRAYWAYVTEPAVLTYKAVAVRMPRRGTP